MKFGVKNETEACCARCGLPMGFPYNGQVYYCLNEHTCG